jgi:AcrR family transcriptional regulator
LFEEHGFEGTTTGAIARAAGIGTGTLFLYFRSKEDLLVAVFREEVGQAWDDAFALVDDGAPLLDQLLTAFNAVVAYHERDPRLARAFLKELLFVGEPVGGDVRRFMAAFLKRLDRLLRAAQSRGALDPAVPTRTLGANLFAAYYTLVQQRHTGQLGPAELTGRLAESFSLQLRGLIPEPGSPHPASG